MDSLLENLALTLQFSHIGPETLAWLLYSLDPGENDEAIVSQRKLLKNGYPKWFRVLIREGRLSLDGEVSLAGAPIDIPRVENVNISDLPGLAPYEAHLANFEMLIEALNIFSSDVMVIQKDGSIQFDRTRKAGP